MTTNFFTQLIETNLDFKANLTISYSKNTSTASVSIRPLSDVNNDSATTKIKPLILSGTLEELDEAFLQTVKAPIVETQSFFNNAKQYLERKQFAEKQTQKEKDKKANIKKLEDSLNKIISDSDFNTKDVNLITKVKKIISQLKGLNPKNKCALDALKVIDDAQAQTDLFPSS